MDQDAKLNHLQNSIIPGLLLTQSEMHSETSTISSKCPQKLPLSRALLDVPLTPSAKKHKAAYNPTASQIFNTFNEDDFITNEKFDFDTPFSPLISPGYCSKTKKINTTIDLEDSTVVNKPSGTNRKANATFTQEDLEQSLNPSTPGPCGDNQENDDGDEIFFGAVGHTEKCAPADMFSILQLSESEQKEVAMEAQKLALMQEEKLKIQGNSLTTLVINQSTINNVTTVVTTPRLTETPHPIETPHPTEAPHPIGTTAKKRGKYHLDDSIFNSPVMTDFPKSREGSETITKTKPETTAVKGIARRSLMGELSNTRGSIRGTKRLATRSSMGTAKVIPHASIAQPTLSTPASATPVSAFVRGSTTRRSLPGAVRLQVQQSHMKEKSSLCNTPSTMTRGPTRRSLRQSAGKPIPTPLSLPVHADIYIGEPRNADKPALMRSGTFRVKKEDASAAVQRTSALKRPNITSGIGKSTSDTGLMKCPYQLDTVQKTEMKPASKSTSALSKLTKFASKSKLSMSLTAPKSYSSKPASSAVNRTFEAEDGPGLNKTIDLNTTNNMSKNSLRHMSGLKSNLKQPSSGLQPPKQIKSLLTGRGAIGGKLRPNKSASHISGPMVANAPIKVIQKAAAPTRSSPRLAANNKPTLPKPSGIALTKSDIVSTPVKSERSVHPKRLLSAAGNKMSEFGQRFKKKKLPESNTESSSNAVDLISLSPVKAPVPTGVLIDLDFNDKSPNSMKSGKSKVIHTPINKENARLTTKRSAWSPIVRRKPLDIAEQSIICTKHRTLENNGF